MKTPSVVGTAATFVFGGGILLHVVPALGRTVAAWAQGLGTVAGTLVETGAGAAADVTAGALIVGALAAVRRVRP